MSRNIIVFGASGILGEHITAAFNDDRLILCDIKEPEEIPDNCTYIRCDVTSGDDIDSLAARLEADGIRPDVLIYSAGIFNYGSVTDISPEAWSQAMDVNVTGLYRVLHRIIPVLSDGAAIIAVASQYGIVGTYESASYCASKAAMINLIRSVALDYGSRKITANCVCPGFFGSDFLKKVEKQVKKKREWMTVTAMLPRSRVNAEEVVQAIEMLAVNPAITGQCIVIDGGYTAR